MAIQNIQFKGMRHSPSDITGQDGDLLECVNLIHENGELKPIEMPEKMQLHTDSDFTLAAVHNVVGEKIFVSAKAAGGHSYIKAMDTNGNPKQIGGGDIKTILDEEIQWAETIGNTLIIGTDKSTHYALYKNGAYKWLGDKLPQPVFEFDLETGGNGAEGGANPFLKDWKGNTAPGGGIPIYYTKADNPPSDAKEIVNDEENKKLFAENVNLKIAKLISKNKKDAKFVFPFMVRYALRMFDGKYSMHSAPILMLPSTDICPFFLTASYFGYAYCPDYDGDVTVSDMIVVLNPTVRYLNKKLRYKFVGFYIGDTNVTSYISDWDDIIRGVDIFLSSQIVTYDENYFSNIDNIDLELLKEENLVVANTGVGGYSYHENQKDSINTLLVTPNFVPPTWPGVNPSTEETIQVDDGFTSYFRNTKTHRCYPLPSKNNGSIIEEIKNSSLFYRTKQYDISELTDAGFYNITKYLDDEIEYGLLERLETLPTLPDDYVSRCRMTGKVNYNYNQRLLLGNIKLESPLWYKGANTYNSDNYSLRVCFEIEKKEKTIYVRWDKPIDNGYGLGENDFGHYIYYPDPDCKRAVVEIKNDKGEVVATKTVPMHEHMGLNGAFALMPNLRSLYESYSSFKDGTLQDQSDDRYYNIPNTIAMSSVANPFHFPATNFKDIGRTKVVGISANTLDVSSGQWGQYPLYVFCSDGIIAVMIDGEGKFGGIQAVSADVLREPRGLSRPTLVQTGQALMFLTQRGVMGIAGTKINCLSEAMNGRHFNTVTELADVAWNAGSFASLVTESSDSLDFKDFAASGFLAYDYAHNRVLLLRSDKTYQYVFSLNTGLWSKQCLCVNLPYLQFEQIPGNQADLQRATLFWETAVMRAAVNNYTEMYLQDTDGWLFKTMDVAGENSVKQIYQYGYLVSRPIRFGTDEYKTLVRVLHRYTHYANMSFVKMALYGSRDGVKYGRINTLRGMSYQYFIFVVYTYLKPNERYSYLTVDFENRLTNKLR